MGLSELLTIQSPVGAEFILDGRRFINFGGSSYLGLAGKAQVIEAGVAALRLNGSGYQFARHYKLVSASHQRAEAQAAAFFGTEAALYLANGYAFGLVALAALRERERVVFFDELAHHCLREGIAASGLPAFPFRHLDVEDLLAKLGRHLSAGAKPVIVTDGLYSTLGEIAPLDDLAQVAKRYEGQLVVDESHAFGVLGDRGRGANEHHGLDADSVLIGGSSGKGFGVLGGLVPASSALVAELRKMPASRSASVGLPAAAAMCAEALSYVREHPELLRALRTNTIYMKSRMRDLGLDIPDNVAPIAAFSVGSQQATSTLQHRLMETGIYVLHSNYIGVGQHGLIRCAVFADHTQQHIDHLVDALGRLL